MSNEITITAEQISRMDEAVLVNCMAGTDGVAMKGEIDGYQVWFDLAGREQDDEAIYTPANIINVEPIA